MYARTSTVGEKKKKKKKTRPFLLVFLYEHQIHIWIQVAPGSYCIYAEELCLCGTAKNV